VLAYGGCALLGWLHNTLVGDPATASNMAWLRDGTAALPFVALVVLLAERRSQQGEASENKNESESAGQKSGRSLPVGMSVQYATVMGAGIILQGFFSTGSHLDHAVEEGGQADTTGLLVHAGIIMVAAAIYALVAHMAATQLEGMGRVIYPAPLVRALVKPGWSRFALVGVMAGALLPVYMFMGHGIAAAQTSFPDQVIHPKGSLTLVAQNMPDGSLAYVAPDFGANGVRPTIEMVEGETLNITLKNQLSVDVSLHVHGVHYNLDSDGTRHSNSFVKAGGQRVYQWRAAVGTSGYWHYHDHVVGDDEGTEGILRGLYGALVVRKPGDPKPAHTFVIVGNDKTLNGRVYPDTPTYTARQGELVEWVVISHGNRVHTFHLHGHRWITPNRTGDPNPGAAANVGSGHEDNHILAPGDSFGFLVIAGDDVGPGMWMYHCHFQDHSASMKGFFNVLPPGPSAQAETSRTFKETGKTVSGRFLEYWNQNGGLAQQGFPLSDEFQEVSELDGKTYTVQYFERAVFEKHPENPKPYDVLLSQLGTFRYKQKYPGGR
jgi:hypothetical protein